MGGFDLLVWRGLIKWLIYVVLEGLSDGSIDVMALKSDSHLWGADSSSFWPLCACTQFDSFESLDF